MRNYMDFFDQAIWDELSWMVKKEGSQFTGGYNVGQVLPEYEDCP